MSAYAEQPPPIKELRKKKWIRYTIGNPQSVFFLKKESISAISRSQNKEGGGVAFCIWLNGDSTEFRVFSNDADISEVEEFYKELSGE